MILSLIAEATECDFKSKLERGKPISWLKSVSAFANGIGGTLLFGVNDDGSIVGLANAQSDAEFISGRIKERVAPLPDFVLTPYTENCKDVLALVVKTGRHAPYYYSAEGRFEENHRRDKEASRVQRGALAGIFLDTVIFHRQTEKRELRNGKINRV